MTHLPRSQRTRSLLSGRIQFNSGFSVYDCTVRNISASGAKIDLGGVADIPAEFDLFLPDRKQTFRARIVWRNHREMGLVFLNTPDAPVDEAPGAVAGPLEAVASSLCVDEADESDDVGRLVAENARLRDEVADLRAEIEAYRAREL